MKKIQLFLLSFLWITTSCAQDLTIPLFPEGIPCENDLTMKIKKEKIGRIISKVHTPELEVFLPPKEKSNGTSVIICPGGGYTILAYDWEGTKMAKWFNSFGVTAFVLKYRLPHWESVQCRSEVALQDVQRAMRLVRSKAATYNIKPNQIGIMGFSAGGHLAASLSTHFDTGNSESAFEVEKYSCRPDFSLLIYPVISMEEGVTHGGSRDNLLGKNPTPAMIGYFSNEKQITTNTPPAILIHANDDKVVVPENSIRYYLGLREKGIPAALHIYESGGHGFSFAEDKGATAGWAEAVKSWMKDRALF